MKVIKGKDAGYKKKGNVAMWDAIDALTEEYLQKLLEFSEKNVDPDSFEDFEQDILDLGKEITETAVDALEKKFGAEFVYVDCNY